MPLSFVSFRPLFLSASVLFLGGCASLSQDSGFSSVQSMTKERIGQEVKWVKSDADANSVATTIQPLLAQPLSVDDAVKIALLNNKGLQASYSELGIAEANLVQAGRLKNPSFTFGRLRRGDDIEIDRSLMLPVMSLLTMPIASKIERRYFEQAQLRAAAEALAVADATRHAYFSAVSAQETVKYMTQVTASAEGGAQLANKMAAVGNWSKLEQMRQQSFYADVTVQLARAAQMQVAEREKLTRLLGLWGSNTGFQLPDRLPDLPKAPDAIGDIEVQAMQNRLDIMMAKRELAGLASSLGLTKTTRFINILDVGLMHNNYNQSPSRENGYSIQLEIPLFDWGGARVAKSEALYMQAVNRAAELAVNARSEVRVAYADYRSTYDIARHYRDEIVPLKKRISDEQMLRYNGMLIGVFTLLADARAQVISVNGAIEALRDYWIADSALKMAQTGRSSAGSGAKASNSAAMSTD
ncbi:TolC family protein [Glaciimonas sp. Gout2]|uniref:TolC family protein n=1 Tax=unclassified Glaciimonas TaxID=2644401 RepID=UPI002B2321A6|nr:MULTISPECIES: TolC family protein [unclassified Glaciimonas]MEB0011410.1 TolC family protein [Glaciimonas sp. Cout2]MEB0081061.1 TolC family protein [Glaciimonas sp. Gout2]